MGDTVFANGKAVVHKGSSGKTAGCPSPVLCPPSPPAGPVPTPLPNMAMASDLDGGAKSVLTENNPTGHADSFLKKSMGDEPCLPPPTFAAVVSHVKNGKAYYASHSMDVFFEGKAAITHADLTLHDCAMTPNTATWPFLSNMSTADQLKCEGAPEECKLVPYKDGCGQTPAEKATMRSQGRAHEIKTPHHLIQDHSAKGVAPKPGKEEYRHGNAPCVCATGVSRKTKGPDGQPLQHARYHRAQGIDEAKVVLTKTGADLSKPAPPGGIKAKSDWTYKEAKASACAAAEKLDFCPAACIEAQLDSYYKNRCGFDEDEKMLAEIDDGDFREGGRQALNNVASPIKPGKG